MIASHGYAAQDAKTPLAPFTFERRDPGPNDVVIDIQFCGVCHSDLHQARDEWGNSLYPMVPGHEIVGRVVRIGNAVTRFKVGDTAAVGVLVDSCRVCPSCKAGEQQYCDKGMTPTYNGRDKNGELIFGGYANNIVVDEAYTHHISSQLNPAAVAPLLCAGITTYSPLRHWQAGKGKKVGIVGLGGLGHMGLKFAHSFGAHVVQFTTSLNKKEDALRLGANEVVLSKDEAAMQAHANSFDFILDTAAAPHDLNIYLNLLKRDGAMALVGLPDQPPTVHTGALAFKRRALTGSIVGGIPETQEMLDYCAEHSITADIELIPIQKIEEAYSRIVRNDVKYRFVIDMASLPNNK